MNRPRVSIVVADGRTHYSAGDVLVCEYSIQLHPADKVTAVESSVIWHTDGKGEEDLGVHFFQRRKQSTLDASQLAQTHRISTVLPKSPLSYDGAIVQIRWCVRLRIFFAGGGQFTEDLPFVLGGTVPVSHYETVEDADE